MELSNKREKKDQRESVPPTEEDPLAAAKSLLAFGYEVKAREKAIAILEEGKVKAGRIISDAALEEGRLDRLATGAKGLSENVQQIGIAWVSLLFIAWGIAYGTWKLVRKGAGYLPFRFLPRSFRSLRRPCQIVVSNVENPTDEIKVGRDLRERIAEELAHASSPAKHIYRVSEAGVTPVALATALPSQAQFLDPLLKWIQRPRQYHIVAVPQSPLGKLASLSVRIQEANGRLVKQEQIQLLLGSDKSATYLELGTLAGAWALFQIQSLLFPAMDPTKISVLGSTEWKSYGLFRRAERLGRLSALPGRVDADEQLEKLLHEALAHDHNNAGALVLLGQQQARRFKDDKDDLVEVDSGIVHLDRAKEILDKNAHVKEHWFLPSAHDGTKASPLWFQATYQCTVAHLHRFAHSQQLCFDSGVPVDTIVPDELSNGINLAVELANAIGATQLTLSGLLRKYTIPANERESLIQMLDHDASYLLGLLAGALSSKELIERRSLIEPESKAEFPAEKSKKLWESLKTINGQGPPRAQSIVGILENEEESAGLPLRYNLACVHARACNAAEALKNLEIFLEHLKDSEKRRWIDWARKDPSLKPVRDHGKAKEDFQKLLTHTVSNDEPAPSASPAAPAGEWRVERVVDS
jgi:hypothetical protein